MRGGEAGDGRTSALPFDAGSLAALIEQAQETIDDGQGPLERKFDAAVESMEMFYVMCHEPEGKSVAEALRKDIEAFIAEGLQ